MLALVALCAVLASVLILGASSFTAFGLIPPAYSAEDFEPVTVKFRSDILTSQQLLELSADDHHPGSDAVAVAVTNPLTPPPVEEFTALNTRIGREVILFWEVPNGVDAVNIYRQQRGTNTDSDEELIAENVEGDTYTDATVTNNTTYRYRVVSVAFVESEGRTKEYLSVLAPTADVTPKDTIAPQPPQNVVVQTRIEDDESVVEVRWDEPQDLDVEYVQVFRSLDALDIGSVVGLVERGEESIFVDEDVSLNTEYFYTVVAVDVAGNASHVLATVPPLGNESPFTRPSDFGSENIGDIEPL